MMSRQDIIGNTKPEYNVKTQLFSRATAALRTVARSLSLFRCLMHSPRIIWLSGSNTKEQRESCLVSHYWQKISGQWFKYVFINLFKHARCRSSNNIQSAKYIGIKIYHGKWFHCITLLSSMSKLTIFFVCFIDFYPLIQKRSKSSRKKRVTSSPIMRTIQDDGETKVKQAFLNQHQILGQHIP